MKTSLIALAAAIGLLSTATAYPVMVYKAVDTSTPTYTLHNPDYPLYVQTSRSTSTVYLLKDLETSKQAIIRYGVVGKTKVAKARFTTAGNWGTVEQVDYSARLRVYTYPLSLTSTLNRKVHFELLNKAPVETDLLQEARTTFLRGTEQTIKLTKSQDEVEVPSLYKGSGTLWSEALYIENPSNARDFDGTMTTTGLISISQVLSVPYSDRVNTEFTTVAGVQQPVPAIQGHEPGSLPYAVASMVQLLQSLGYTFTEEIYTPPVTAP